MSHDAATRMLDAADRYRAELIASSRIRRFHDAVLDFAREELRPLLSRLHGQTLSRADKDRLQHCETVLLEYVAILRKAREAETLIPFPVYQQAAE